MKSIIIFQIIILLNTFVYAAAWDEGKEWLEVSKEYKDEILEQLENSKQFTENQLEVIDDCLNESNVKEVLNCFSGGGVEGAAGALTIIRDELEQIRERICGKGSWRNKDKCQKFGESLDKLRTDLQKTWGELLQKGKDYLEQSNNLLFMKRKICRKINQDGCYRWLNERIDLKCNPKKTGNDPAIIEKCRLDVTQEVWDRVNSQ